MKVSGVVEDLKLKISEGSDQNWCFPDSSQLAVSVKPSQISHNQISYEIEKMDHYVKMFLKPVWVGKIHGVEDYATHVVRIWWFSNKFSIFQLKRM